jgi:uncharacterized protein (DUF305 family)
MMRTAPLILALALAGCGTTQTPTSDNQSAANAMASDNVTTPAEPLDEAQRAYAEASKRMHAGMGRIDPDADVAFMQGMIPHHRGAVEMAEIALKYGKDPEVRKLAQTVIAAQQAEIAQMERWLAKRGAAAPAAAAAGEHAGH